MLKMEGKIQLHDEAHSRIPETGRGELTDYVWDSLCTHQQKISSEQQRCLYMECKGK